MNKAILIGRLGKDPETRFFPSGDQMTTAALATSRRWKDKQTGERKEKTSWHNLVFNRGLAKIAVDYLKKGSQIYVEGEIDYNEWEKDGVKHRTTRIIVSDMHMLDSNPNNSDSGSQQSGNAKQASNSRQQPPAQSGGAQGGDYFDDDIPFASLNQHIKNHLL